MAKRRVSLGAQIDKIFKMSESIRVKKKAIEAEEDKLKELKTALLENMKEQGIENARGTAATVFITVNAEPSVADWDKFYPWMYKNKMGPMMFRRLNPKVYREILELRHNRAIPGVETFNKETLNLRRRTD